MATHIRIEDNGSTTVAMSTVDGFCTVDSSVPLKLLEQAIAACVGRKLLSLASKNPVKLLGGVTVSICEETVKIRSTASKKVSEAVAKAVRECYVLEQLKLPKELLLLNSQKTLRW